MNYEIELQNQNGVCVVSSRVIAKQLEKRHDHVLRDLENILNSETPNLGSLIISSLYKVEGQERQYKEYLLTKDGFILYMFNIQGYLDFKIAYINEFNRMEKELNKKDDYPLIFKKPKEKVYLESYRVAEKMHKAHDKVVKDIESFKDRQDFEKHFILSGTMMENNKKINKYNVDRVGCRWLIEKAPPRWVDEYKVAYAEWFNDMEWEMPPAPEEILDDKYFIEMIECIKEAYKYEIEMENFFKINLEPLYKKIEDLSKTKREMTFTPFNCMKYGRP